MFEFNIINGSSETITQNTIFLIDTNVLSELMREKPNQGVVDFFSTDLKMIISAITVQELFFGYENIPNTMVAKKKKNSFETKIAPVTMVEAKIAGEFQGFQKQNGRNISHFDAIVAGTCLHLGAVLVTRNVKDFEHFDIPILNPFIS
jgi:toxin FitB